MPEDGLLCISVSYGSASLASQDLNIETTSALSLVPLLGDENSIDLEDVRDEKKTNSADNVETGGGGMGE